MSVFPASPYFALESLSAALIPRPWLVGNIDQGILGRSIAAEIALHSRESGEVTHENAAMKKLAAQFYSVP
jgi:hypothetical protein